MKRYYICVLLLLTVLAGGCAKQGYPSGGPKDTAPPKMQAARPANETTGFTSQEFFVEFDEYVVLKDASNNVLVSPPMDPAPEYTTKGRGVLVKIKDTLLPNTTYLFQFKDAIADFNEGNVLPSLEYVFSTGNGLDSMSITGNVVDAQTLKPREGETVVTVVAFLTMDSLLSADSIVGSGKPDYVTRCDKDGKFEFNYIQPGRYRLVAMEDGNKNLKLDADEAMAFASRSFQSYRMPKTDTSSTLSISIKDKVATPEAKDSINKRGEKEVVSRETSKTAPTGLKTAVPEKIQAPIRLLISNPPAESQPQRILSSEYTKRGEARIVAQQPFKHPEIKDLWGEQLYWDLNPKGDTLTLWTRNAQCDSLRLTVQDGNGLSDTLKMRYRAPKRALPSAPNGGLTMTANIKAKTAYFDTLRLEFSRPVRPNGDFRILFCSDDSTHQGDITSFRKRTIGSDTSWLLCVQLTDFVPKAGKRYEFFAGKNLFQDIYGHTTDSARLKGEFTKAEDYGSIIITFDSTCPASPSQLVVELLNEKGSVVQSHRPVKEAKPTVRFVHLNPGTYRIRCFIDSNNDSQWNGGDYWSDRHPEPVYYFPKTLNLKANWDMEEVFKF